jgi:hypothetical protein
VNQPFVGLRRIGLVRNEDRRLGFEQIVGLRERFGLRAIARDGQTPAYLALSVDSRSSRSLVMPAA